MQAAKAESTGGANGSGNGGGGTVPTPTPNPAPPAGNFAVSCNMMVGTPTFTEAPITLTVLGNVSRITVDGQTVALPEPGYTEVKLRYPVTSAGNKNVTAYVQNLNAGTANTCSTSFVAPDLADARKTVVPADGANYRYSNEVLITNHRYLFAVSKVSGQGWYNSISLDPNTKPGQLDAWMGWKIIPGQPVGTGTLFPIVVTKYSDNSYIISAINFDGTAVATVATCNGGVCNFSAWSEY